MFFRTLSQYRCEFFKLNFNVKKRIHIESSFLIAFAGLCVFENWWIDESRHDDAVLGGNDRVHVK